MGDVPASESMPGESDVRHRCRACRGRARVPGIVKTTGIGKGMGSGFGPCPVCDGLGYVGHELDEDDSG